jgi:hypothetical protein
MDEHWEEGSIRGRIGTGRYTIEPTLVGVNGFVQVNYLCTLVISAQAKMKMVAIE